MAKLSLFEKVFSITNSGMYKVVTVLGIPFKFDRTKFYQKKYRSISINNNKIVIENFNGNSYGCNPKYIVEEIIKRNLPFELVWIVKNVAEEKKHNNFPSKIRLVSRSSKEALKELSSAKLWIDNQRKIYYLKRGLEKKHGQYYIQTWHGSLGIKKLDADVRAFDLNTRWIYMAKQDSSMIDYFISNSKFEDNIVSKALWYDKEIREFGHPRNDIFFKDNSSIKDKVFDYFKIPKSKKIVLYVPSFRDNGDMSWYTIDYQRMLESMNKKWGEEWVCISRLHPRAKKFAQDLLKKEFPNVVDGSFYPDIQELLVASDAAITDYSSCIFDFMLGRKPGFIFATDIEDYNTERGFYYPLESTPFPVAINNEQLANNILNFDNEKYQKDIDLFLADKGCMEDGHASERVVDLIEKIMKDEV